MVDLTEQEKGDIRSHDLTKPIVRQMLSGYIHQLLQTRNPRKIGPADINAALDRYVEGLDEMLDRAITIHASWRKPGGRA